jgi:MYXO-CTERM domain-containing protein
MGCKGLHCDGCNHASSPAGPAAAVLALLVIVAVAAREVWPKVVHAVEIAAWIVAGTIGAALILTATVLTVRAVRRARARHAERQVTCHATVILNPPRAAQRPAPGQLPPPTARSLSNPPRAAQPPRTSPARRSLQRRPRP